MRRFILFAALALAGCTTPQERAARAQADMESDMQLYGPACLKLGYAAGSDPWRACILQLAAKEDMRYNNYPPYYGPGRWRGGGFWGPYW